MHDRNLDVPGNVVLAFEIIVLLLYMTLLNGFDHGVDKGSKCTVPSPFVRKTSRRILHQKNASVVHVH
jgi:hypothetical protein